jgi:O-antigen/teichoic acid export membrane protein
LTSKPSPQSKTVHTIAIFASGNTVAMLLGVVGSFVQARYIAPEEMGVFRTFGIVAGYLTFLHLGVFDGLQREIPLQMGRGNQAEAERAASACLAWIVFISLIGGVLFLALALRAACYHEWMRFWGWLAYTPVIAATFYAGYLGTTFRSGQQFISLSRIAVIQAIAGTLVLPLLPIMGYYGACLRATVGSVTNIFFLHRWRPLKVCLRFNWPRFREVVRIGLPLSGIGYLATSLWVSLEGTFMLEWFGIKSLGLYSVALFVRGMVNQLAQNMNQVMNIKVYEQYGRSGRVEDCLRVIFKPMVLAFLASLPLIVVGWSALPWAVSRLIPKYVGAISMTRVVLLSMPITFLSLPVTILWATGRLIDCFTGVIVGFLAFAGLSYLLYRLNVGALSVLIASILGQAINVLVSYMLILRLVLKEKRTSTDKGALCYDIHVEI